MRPKRSLSEIMVALESLELARSETSEQEHEAGRLPEIVYAVYALGSSISYQMVALTAVPVAWNEGWALLGPWFALHSAASLVAAAVATRPSACLVGTCATTVVLAAAAWLQSGLLATWLFAVTGFAYPSTTLMLRLHDLSQDVGVYANTAASTETLGLAVSAFGASLAHVAGFGLVGAIAAAASACVIIPQALFYVAHGRRARTLKRSPYTAVSSAEAPPSPRAEYYYNQHHDSKAALFLVQGSAVDDRALRGSHTMTVLSVLSCALGFFETALRILVAVHWHHGLGHSAWSLALLWLLALAAAAMQRDVWPMSSYTPKNACIGLLGSAVLFAILGVSASSWATSGFVFVTLWVVLDFARRTVVRQTETYTSTRKAYELFLVRRGRLRALGALVASFVAPATYFGLPACAFLVQASACIVVAAGLLSYTLSKAVELGVDHFEALVQAEAMLNRGEPRGDVVAVVRKSIGFLPGIDNPILMPPKNEEKMEEPPPSTDSLKAAPFRLSSDEGSYPRSILKKSSSSSDDFPSMRTLRSSSFDSKKNVTWHADVVAQPSRERRETYDDERGSPTTPHRKRSYPHDKRFKGDPNANISASTWNGMLEDKGAEDRCFLDSLVMTTAPTWHSPPASPRRQSDLDDVV